MEDKISLNISLKAPKNKKNLKALIVGPENAGKTSLINYYLGKEKESLNTSDHKFDYFITYKKNKIKLIFHLVDLNPRFSFPKHRDYYYKDADIICVVLKAGDKNNTEFKRELKEEIEYYFEKGFINSNTIFFFLGNKQNESQTTFLTELTEFGISIQGINKNLKHFIILNVSEKEEVISFFDEMIKKINEKRFDENKEKEKKKKDKKKPKKDLFGKDIENNYYGCYFNPKK